MWLRLWRCCRRQWVLLGKNECAIDAFETSTTGGHKRQYISNSPCSVGAPRKMKFVAQFQENKEKRDCGGHGRAATRGNTSHLRTSYGKFHVERIKQVDKIEKLILRIKGRRWRHLALLGFVFV